MYDFLFSEVYWMDAIISALITGAVTIVAAIITYQVKISKILNNSQESNKRSEKLLEKSNALSSEHKDLSSEHKDLSSEHKQIITMGTDIKTTVQDINKIVSEEKIKQEFRYNNLTEKQKDILNITNAVQSLQSELLRLQSENAILRERVEILSREKDKSLSQKANKQKQNNPQYEHDDYELEM